MDGGSPSTEEMTERVYNELRRLARAYLRRQLANPTLQPTELVHEAYLRLAGWRSAPWRDRAQFVGVAAMVMRQVLAAHARRRAAGKREGGHLRVSLSKASAAASEPVVDMLALDEALTELEASDAQACRIVELRFFGGLGIDEVADCLDISPATVKRSWVFSKTWLRQRLELGAM